jgi:hypothetical protein
MSNVKNLQELGQKYTTNVLGLNPTPYCHVSLHTSQPLTLKYTKKIKPDTHMHHHCNIVIIAMLTMYCSILSHATLILVY